MFYEEEGVRGARRVRVRNGFRVEVRVRVHERVRVMIRRGVEL